jgi:hypothetical protein
MGHPAHFHPQAGLPGASRREADRTRGLRLVGARQRDNTTTRSHAARWSLMAKGIAAHYTTSATPTTEPTAGLENRAFRASAITEVTKPSRPWCVTGALTRRQRVQYVKRLRTGGPCRAFARERHARPQKRREHVRHVLGARTPRVDARVDGPRRAVLRLLEPDCGPR